MVMRRQHVSVGLAVMITATLASGVAVAAKPSPKAVKACVNAKGVLGVGSAKGACAKGYSKISLDVVGPRGPKGAAGATGKTGLTGKTGTFNAADVKTITVTKSVAGSSGSEILAVCPTGEVAIGGGAGFSDFQGLNQEVVQSEPSTAAGDPPALGTNGVAWEAYVINNASDPQTAEVYAICAT